MSRLPAREWKDGIFAAGALPRQGVTRSTAAVAVLTAMVAAVPCSAEEKQTLQSSATSDVAATVAATPITIAEVDAAVGGRLMALRAQEYALRRRALNTAIEQRLLEAEASRRKLTVADLLREEVDSKLPPSEGNAGGNNPRARADRRGEFLKELRQRYGVKVLLQPPRQQIEAGDGPSRGPADAPVTIVEFSDFQCPYCGRVEPTLKQLMDRYPGQIRIVFRHFPLAMHKQAPKAAEAAACAQEQGKFWEFHARLFANQRALEIADLKRHAGELGLDQQKFDECLDTSRMEPRWRRDMSEGTRHGVTGTPAFFINGRFVSGAQSLATFAEIVDEELAIRRTAKTSDAQ